MKYILINFLLLISLISTSNGMDLILFPSSTGSRCLDGSPYGIYYSPGFDFGQRKVIISFWGGGLCEGRTETAFLSDCFERSKTNLGSSNYWDNITSYNSGFLSEDKKENPNFFNWNKFDLPYCDGSFHQGNLSMPLEYEGNKLFFRGRQNVITALDYITKKIDLKSIDEIVITGGSTGGYATYTFANYIKDLMTSINKEIKVIGIADSGFFVDYYNYKTKDNDYHIMNKLFYEIVNKEVPPITSPCLLEFPQEHDLCLFPEHFVKYVDIPILILQSGYDSSNLYETVGLDCVQNNTLASCDEENINYSHIFKLYQNFLIKKEIERHEYFSAWLPACVTHCFDDKLNWEDWEVPENSGRTVNKVVEKFLENPKQKNIYIDEILWPENKRCANKRSNLFLKF